jgi:hypothetical protein
VALLSLSYIDLAVLLVTLLGISFKYVYYVDNALRQAIEWKEAAETTSNTN